MSGTRRVSPSGSWSEVSGFTPALALSFLDLCWAKKCDITWGNIFQLDIQYPVHLSTGKNTKDKGLRLNQAFWNRMGLCTFRFFTECSNQQFQHWTCCLDLTNRCTAGMSSEHMNTKPVIPVQQFLFQHFRPPDCYPAGWPDVCTPSHRIRKPYKINLTKIRSWICISSLQILVQN